MPGRRWQIVLVGTTLSASWLGMQLVHESGHVLGAWVSGGRGVHIVWSPWTFSRTDLAENPHPLLVVWAGPIVGVVLPLLLWGVLAASRLVVAFVGRFFAGFCLLVNGAYIGAGSWQGVGDCGVMLHHGSAPWQLWLFGALTTPLGLWLWHGQGVHFGLGAAGGRVNHRATCATAGLCLALWAAALWH